MCFKKIISIALTMMLCVSCSQYRKIEQMRSGEVRMSLALSGDKPEETEIVNYEDGGVNEVSGEPFIMNAVKDEETGDMVATDILTAATVTAGFRNVAERSGYVMIEFDVNVPATMLDSRFRLKLYPQMIMQEDTCDLESVIITGAKYREGQLRGYERYRRYLSSIVTDTTDLIRIGQLEVFLQRHFPETYKMKNDSSLISDPLAETLFGATQEEALRHYTRTIRRWMNERRMGRKEEMLRRYVKDPILSDGIRLDTVCTAENGDFVYRYQHTFRVRPLLKKVAVSIRGYMFAEGEIVAELPESDELEFYISSLTSLVDASPRNRTIVLERRAYGKITADLDFEVGSARLDTALGDNAVELLRIRKCISDAAAREEYVLDSVMIVASCSPEGSWAYNKMLARRRSDAILESLKAYVAEEWRDSLKTASVPENWAMLRVLIEKDSLLSLVDKKMIGKIVDDMDDPDKTERLLSRHPRYAYIKDRHYPKLRCVTFDFYLHRVGMVKDTVHTTEPDTLYMSGLSALQALDYNTALKLLGPYRDYNAALAYLSLGRNYSALEILRHQDPMDAKVNYLLAIVLSRLGEYDDAWKCYQISKARDPSLCHRANLDPELSVLFNINN